MLLDTADMEQSFDDDSNALCHLTVIEFDINHADLCNILLDCPTKLRHCLPKVDICSLKTNEGQGR